MKTHEDRICIDAVRDLCLAAIKDTDVRSFMISMNAVNIGYALWSRILRHNPADPKWYGRDRVVIGAGVNAVCLYAFLHLTGYAVSRDDLGRYRQLGSRTPGHPEAGMTPGVEATVGSFGEGFGAAVGMAMAEKHQAATINAPGFPVVDNFTYAVIYDGDLQEGVSHEAASLAGFLKLGKLICLYNRNSEAAGRAAFLSDGDDLRSRFASYGWEVLDADGQDPDDIALSVNRAKADGERPSLIIVGGADAGAMDVPFPPGDYEPPQAALRVFRRALEEGAQAENGWLELVGRFKSEYPDKAAILLSAMSGDRRPVPGPCLPDYKPGDAPVSTADACRGLVSALTAADPGFFGGECVLMPGPGYDAGLDFTSQNPGGRVIRYGNREQAMGAIMTGIALYGGLYTYGGAFCVLSDYMRPSMRVAAMMGLDLVYLLNNDSAWNGRDGPTHQPAEQLAALRAVPGLTVIRPADAAEAVKAWAFALSVAKGPVAMALSKNPLPILEDTRPDRTKGVEHGAYVLYESDENFDVILISTGSEVSVTLEACRILEKKGVKVRLVNMPSWELFEAQSPEYRQSVLPSSCRARLAVEAAVSMGWHKYAGDAGGVLALDRFGLSAPAEELARLFRFTPEDISEAALTLL